MRYSVRVHGEIVVVARDEAEAARYALLELQEAGFAGFEEEWVEEGEEDEE